MSKLMLDGLPTEEDVYCCRSHFHTNQMVLVGRVEAIQGGLVDVRLTSGVSMRFRRRQVWRRLYEAEVQAIGIIEAYVAELHRTYAEQLEYAGKALDLLKNGDPVA